MERAKLEEFNHWWIRKNVDKELALPYKRKLFFRLIPELKKRFVLGITGLRRVGKTTLMFQLIQHLIDKEIKPQNILFFSFDEAINKLKDVFDTYREIYEKDFRKEKIYVFLDEIQKIKNWENEIKKYYDLYPKLKFIISSSESLFIRKKTKETLAGRLFEFFLPPLSFREYLEVKGISKDEIKFETKIKPLFIKFVERGGFPELIFEENMDNIRKYVRSIVVDKIVYKDIPKLSGIKDPDLLIELLEIISTNPGMYVEYQSLAQQLDRDRRVIKEYIFWLKESFLIRLMANYRKGRLTSLRKKKRAYPTNNAIIQTFKPIIDEQFFGKMVETEIINFLDANLFWKNRHEIDAIIDKNPLEIKYQKKIMSNDLKGIKEFMKKFKCKEGIVISKQEKKIIKNKDYKIDIIPAWSFLLNHNK